MPKVNVISDLDTCLLERQEPLSDLSFVYTRDPTDADWHVVFGLVRELTIPNVSRRCIFVAAEPPEIMRYDLGSLARYGTVLAASFGYLRPLANVRVESGLLPWRVGLSLENGQLSVNMSRRELEARFAPRNETVSVVTSQKADTRVQVKRLRLIEYLSRRMPELQVFGRGTHTIDDKAEALSDSRYHLALENCYQPNYWTEKLADPILMENVTFYSGRNAWQTNFKGSEAIVEIDIGTPKRAYEAMRKVLDSGHYERVGSALAMNKRVLLEDLHLHAAIERAVVGSTGGLDGPALTVVPRHLSRRERLFPIRAARAVRGRQAASASDA